MFRLKELREENGIKRSELARDLGINAGTIANYENEIREAPYDYLLKFAQYFDVSVDYLLGNEEKQVLSNKLSGVLSETERKFINTFRSLSSTAKERIIEYAKLWELAESDSE